MRLKNQAYIIHQSYFLRLHLIIKLELELHRKILLEIMDAMVYQLNDKLKFLFQKDDLLFSCIHQENDLLLRIFLCNLLAMGRNQHLLLLIQNKLLQVSLYRPFLMYMIHLLGSPFFLFRLQFSFRRIR